SGPPRCRGRKGRSPSTPSCAQPTALQTAERRPTSTGRLPQAPAHRLGQAHRAPELARRHVEQHLVHRPRPEPIPPAPPVPTRQHQRLAISRAHPWPLDIDLAAVKADLAAGAAPAVAAPGSRAAMTRPTGSFGVLLHHDTQRLDSGRQAKALETRGDFLECLTHSINCRGGEHCCSCANGLHGVAFLSWNQHPEPTGSRRATPLLIFQQKPGHSLRKRRPDCIRQRMRCCFALSLVWIVSLVTAGRSNPTPSESYEPASFVSWQVVATKRFTFMSAGSACKVRTSRGIWIWPVRTASLLLFLRIAGSRKTLLSTMRVF